MSRSNQPLLRILRGEVVEREVEEDEEDADYGERDADEYEEEDDYYLQDDEDESEYTDRISPILLRFLSYASLTHVLVPANSSAMRSHFLAPSHSTISAASASCLDLTSPFWRAS